MGYKYAGLCQNCYEAITNPVCIDCFLVQTKIWLRQQGIQKDKTETILKTIKKRLKSETIDSPEEQLSCIICGREEVQICSYCFFLKLSRILEDLKVDKILKEKFLETFNYRQGLEEY